MTTIAVVILLGVFVGATFERRKGKKYDDE